jgi:hypothetical protein
LSFRRGRELNECGPGPERRGVAFVKRSIELAVKVSQQRYLQQLGSSDWFTCNCLHRSEESFPTKLSSMFFHCCVVGLRIAARILAHPAFKNTTSLHERRAVPSCRQQPFPLIKIRFVSLSAICVALPLYFRDTIDSKAFYIDVNAVNQDALWPVRRYNIPQTLVTQRHTSIHRRYLVDEEITFSTPTPSITTRKTIHI